MHAEGFFENLGHRIGQWVLIIIEWLEQTLGTLVGAVAAFFRGWMRATSIQPSLFNLILLLIASAFLLIALHALYRSAYINAVLWLIACAFALGWLINS